MPSSASESGVCAVALCSMVGEPSDAGGAPVETTLLREQELRGLNDNYIRALLTGDVEWFRARLADEFVCIESDGLLLDKAAFLRRTAWGSMLASYALEDVAVQCYGEVALVRAKGAWTDKSGISGFSRYVDVYAQTGGEWKVVSAQVTRVVRAV
jgi:hypothetical protein